MHLLVCELRRFQNARCALLRYYAANIGNFSPAFRHDLSSYSRCKKELELEDWKDRLSRNVGMKLPVLAA